MSNPYRGTTPTIPFHIKQGFDLSLIEIAHVTIRNEATGKQKTFNGTLDVENRVLTISLTQEDTLYFNSGALKVQGKFKLTDGYTVIPSKMIEGTLEEILEEEIL